MLLWPLLVALQGGTPSTNELRIFRRFLKEAEPGVSSGSSAPADAQTRSAASSRRRQRSSTSSSRRSASTSRVSGLNVTAKDLPFNQDTRSVRLPKPFGQRRGERVQQMLRQLRQRAQQQRLVRQQRVTQLQLWQLQQEFQQQQQQQPGGSAAQQQPGGAASSSSSDSRSSGAGYGTAGLPGSKRSSWQEALRGFKAGWQQGAQDVELPAAPQQQAATAGSAASAAHKAEAGAAHWVKQLQGVLGSDDSKVLPSAALNRVVIAVVPLDQLSLIEQAWASHADSKVD